MISPPSSPVANRTLGLGRRTSVKRPLVETPPAAREDRHYFASVAEAGSSSQRKPAPQSTEAQELGPAGAAAVEQVVTPWDVGGAVVDGKQVRQQCKWDG